MSQAIGTGKYERLLERCKALASVPTAVVHPCEETALSGAVEAAEAGIIDPILVGPSRKILNPPLSLQSTILSIVQSQRFLTAMQQTAFRLRAHCCRKAWGELAKIELQICAACLTHSSASPGISECERIEARDVDGCDGASRKISESHDPRFRIRGELCAA